MAIIIKNYRQIQKIEQSYQLASDTLQYIKPMVVAGVNTGELDHQIEKYIYQHGALAAPKGYHGYPKATCISVNEVICHGIPSEYKLKDGDIVNIDVTTILDGYFGDVSAMFSIGEISEDAKKIIAVAKKALDVGIEQVKHGRRLSNIGFNIANDVHREGCSVVHQFCGHGVGLEFHEEPQVEHIGPPDEGPMMRVGMVFTIEPMVNLGVPEAIISETDGWTAKTADGALSAQFEHTVTVTRKGVRVMTKHPE